MSALTKRWFALRTHPDIVAATECQARIMLLRCGRRAYKTEICKRKLVEALPMPTKYGEGRYFFAAPTLKQAKKVGWKDFKALIPKDWIAKVSETELWIETIFGSVLELAGLDQPQRLEGVGYDGGVVTESADVRPSALSISIYPALADRDGWLVREGVPKRTGRGARDYNRSFDHAQRFGVIQGTDYEAKAFSWQSSAVLTEKQLAFFRGIMDEKDYREQFEATIETAGGGIWHAWGADNIRKCDYDPTKPIILMIDLNVSPMCWVLAHDYGGKMHVFDELWKLDTHTQACLNAVASNYGNHQAGWLIYGDATSRSRNVASSITNYNMIENDKRLINKRILLPKANPNINDRFACMNAKMRNAAGEVGLYIDPSCEKLIEDIELDSYKEGTMNRDETDKMRGHMCDALGYGIFARYPIVRDNQGTARVGIH